MNDDRGQMLTIEGLVAAFIVVFTLVIIIQTTSVTPLSSSFTNQHIKLELQNIGNDILSTLDQTPLDVNNYNSASELKQSVIDWALYDEYSEFTWSGTELSTSNPNRIMHDTNLTEALKFAMLSNCIVFNVELRYPNSNYVNTSRMIWNGDPSENSVTVSRYIVLNDGEIGEVERVIPKMSTVSGSTFHTTVEVRLTLWVM